MKDILMLILFLVITINVFRRNQIILKRLTKLQLLGVAVSYLVAIIIAFIVIYYIGNLVSGYIHNSILKMIVELLIVIVTLSFCGTILSKVLQKTTKGAFKGNSFLN